MLEKVRSVLASFSKSVVQPLMYLSVIGILLVLGILLSNQALVALVPALKLPLFQFLSKIIYDPLMFLINNLSLIFCVGIAGAMAKQHKGHASLIALMSYFIFLNANHSTVEFAGQLAEPQGMLGLIGTGQASVLGIQVVDMGVFGGIILGCLCGAIFNRWYTKQLPTIIAMFSGIRFPFFLMIIVATVFGCAAAFVWPPVQQGIGALARMIHDSGSVGLYFYGMLNKLLVPTGLHHLVYAPFQFSDIGGTLNLGDQVIVGAYPIRVAEMKMAGVPFSESTYYNSFAFNNVFPYIGIVFAFISTAYKEKKEATKALLLPLLVAAVLSSLTEPIDFLFVFAAPLLFIIHSLICGFSLVLLKVLSVPAATQGGLIAIVLSNLVLGVEKTNWPMLVVLGALNALFYFFLFRFLILKFNMKTPGREDDKETAELEASAETTKDSTTSKLEFASASEIVDDIDALIAGLGGAENIVDLENCFTRLRVGLKSIEKIDESLINRRKNAGIRKDNNDIQIIYGMDVAQVRDQVDARLKKLGKED